MKAKKKGDLLEIMTYILEKSITDNPTTKIKVKHRLPDRDGILREIDIYVETTVNGKLFKYAFECKNYKRGIELKHITDFYSRIEASGIQGYFVTTSNYQKGAAEKAKALRIDLLRLNKRKADGDSISGLVSFRKQFKIEKINIIGKQVPSNVNMDEILNNCPTCKRAIAKIVEEDIVPLLNVRLNEAMKNMYPGMDNIKNISESLDESKAKELVMYTVFNEGTSITHKGMVIPYEIMTLDLKVWNEMNEHKAKNVNSFSYIKHNEDGLLATFSIAEFMIYDQNIIAGITKVEGVGNMLSIGSPLNPDTISVQKGFCLGSIDELGLQQLRDNEESTNEDH